MSDILCLYYSRSGNTRQTMAETFYGINFLCPASGNFLYLVQTF